MMELIVTLASWQNGRRGGFMRIPMGGLCAVLLAAALPLPSSTVSAAVPCDRLSALIFPGMTITLAQVVTAGGFAPPATGGPGAGQAFASLPAFCRVAVALTPSSDSNIDMEVWLPIDGWNG